MDNKIKRAIADSPLSDEDKKHWISILSKLTDSQKKDLLHIILTKTDLRKAKAAVDRALAIIDEAESEAEEEIQKEEAQNKAKEELMKEIKAENPYMPKKPPETKDELKSHQQSAKEKLAALRTELYNISISAHGTPPPSGIQ